MNMRQMVSNSFNLRKLVEALVGVFRPDDSAMELQMQRKVPRYFNIIVYTADYRGKIYVEDTAHYFVGTMI